jgi:CBS domain containing-hemolysin-like protein
LDPDPLLLSSDYITAAALLLLIIMNAIASGAEAALSALENDPPETRISNLLQKPEKLRAALSAARLFLQVSIAVSAVYLLNRPALGLNLSVPETIAAICILLLLPNSISRLCAVRRPLRFADNNRLFLRLINTLMTPFALPFAKKDAPEIAADDPESTHEQEKEMLEGIIRFKDKLVDDIAVSRSDIAAIELQKPFNELIRFIVEAGFSRIPVFEETADNIKGILYVKDLLPHLGKSTSFKWQTLIRPAYFVPQTKRIDDLLEEFRARKVQMAIVVDEYGGTSGLVTMEDILEEIVGDISDEYDKELPSYTVETDGSYIFEGKTRLEDFVKITRLLIKDFEKMAEEVDTLAGLLLELKGDFPKRKESLTYKEYTFQAEEMNKKRITKVRYIPPK